MSEKSLISQASSCFNHFASDTGRWISGQVLPTDNEFRKGQADFQKLWKRKRIGVITGRSDREPKVLPALKEYSHS